MIVAVGSRNKIKVDAVRVALSRYYRDVTIYDVDVPSAVREQPWGDDEIIEGAIYRATRALEAVNGAEIGAGLEAGVVQHASCYFTNAWCAICDSDGKIALGGGFNVALPPHVSHALEAGLDLGQAMSQVTTDLNHAEVGAIGVLTNNLLNRQTAYESIVLCAMARYIRPDLYANMPGIGG